MAIARPVPVAPHERVLELDVLRGFAFLGILLVNVVGFAWPVYLEALPGPRWTAPADRTVLWLLEFLVRGKFFTLFSLLFGIGLGLQWRRIEARGGRPLPFLVRRLLVLMLIGLAHATLLWAGDILFYYAALGLVALLFVRTSPRRLLGWAAACLVVPIVINTGLFAMITLARMVPEGAGELERALSTTSAEYRAAFDQALQVYVHGDFMAMTAQRMEDFGFATMGMFLGGMLFAVLAMFLVGLRLGRDGVVERLLANATSLRRTFYWGLEVGLPLNLLYALLGPGADPIAMPPSTLLRTIAFILGGPALAVGYASGLTLLLGQTPSWRDRLAPLAAVGRTALSNYLLQTLVCTTVFYGYGFGLYGRVGPATGALVAIGLFALQVLLSRWWVRHFRFGPVEWLWRSLTYRRWQPMRGPA